MRMEYKYEYVLVRYGELSTKGKNRKDFIHKLRDNAKYALRDFEGLKFDAQYDRMFIHLVENTDTEALVARLKTVFGISSLSLALRVPSEIEQITEATYEAVKKDTGTFKMDTRRHDKLFAMSSDEVNRHVATKILKNTEMKVDVHHPDHRYIIEIRKDCTYIMSEVYKGAGGYPVGIGGKALLMLSGGIDSPVSGYLTQKRGVSIECIHFASMPYTSQAALEKVLKLARKLSYYQGPIRVHVVNFTKLQLAIYQNTDESYAITVMRRMMYRIASEVANRRKCTALVSGESIGQVASQTLESLQAINAVTTKPVIRPVITYDKLEIIDISNRIDTYDISIEPFEDCCTIFTPHNPVTKPRLDKCELFESKWDYASMVEECVNTIETHVVNFDDKNEEEDYF